MIQDNKWADASWTTVSDTTKTTRFLARALDRNGISTRLISVLDAGKLEFDP